MGTRVLVVDDHPGFRRQARLLLEEAGYIVVGEAADAAAAIAAAERLRPDLVLLDVQLPDDDGFHVADVLARTVPTSAIVLVSGRDPGELRSRIDDSCVRGFVAKADLTPESLLAVLERST